MFLAILGLLALARGFSMETVDGLSLGEVITLSDKWEISTNEETGGTEYRFRIPEGAGASLLLYMKTYLPEFRVLLENEPICSFADIHAVQGRSQHMVRLPRNSLGILAFILCLMRVMLSELYGQVEKRAKMAAYKRLAYMDALTGMQNRAALIKAQQETAEEAGLVCIVLDMNNLKQVNDQYGHQEGDDMIVAAAQVIREVFGEFGTCFRIGGDEFVVLLKDKTTEQVDAALGRLKERISAENRGGRLLPCIAAGYVERKEGEPLSRMIQRTDARMYEEKQRMKKEGGAE